MIKEFNEINIYPEHPKADIVEMFTNFVLDNSGNESRTETLKKLIVLSDKQYHTNTQPEIRLKEKIQNWLMNNWMEIIKIFPDSILPIAHGFALEKIIFENAMKLAQREINNQWLETLDHSEGLYLNPWWNLKSKKK